MPQHEPAVFADLLTWPVRRWLIALGVAVAVFVGLVLTAGLVSVAGPAVWWTVPVTAVGSGLIGLIVSSYLGTPIGADATMCDTRWPILGLIALYLTTEAHSLEPVFSGLARPALAAAAVALLVWALHERLGSENKAMREAASGTADGEVCTTCRPIFTRPTP
ncbi:hypothetical protein [Cryobacterium sp. PH29-G1]|uniref:hypothetical protein n=1 Tax=Cryobacterium sp. PH29-G1 TaxID=3046211 RepID=UPI0024BAF5BC|nr:hypothetical protein [Cryobacterium sp. PH29-G1]MDJ0349416.1 hypothetical protein [Cryobacterium sp. PH29-G1]